ncbi:MAG: hypothetical protein ATN33_00335 [Epulopiscium sp. Nele67-Bin001]|nr:MAG: hypothetical protein BEN18_02310 [Epulopiscium sp. Nuni2H_MBin001]OON94172.1 MAG: hypothetical protein ATN33_00335 [Epulopiscium sp. Nele67-Bin001]
MEELFKAIEDKIYQAGYTQKVSAEEIYDFINNEIEDKLSGSYILMSKPADDTVFEYKIEIFEDDFNLSYIKIIKAGQEFFVDLD